MKRIKTILVTLLIIVAGANMANAQSASDIFGKIFNKSGSSDSSSSKDSGLGSTLGNMLEGVFSSSDISVSDLTGTWKSSGPAVSFQGDNFLKKAGGVAAAAAIESKLEPYFKQYGLNNAQLTVDSEGNFALKVKKITLKGTVTETKEKGVFDFNFQALGGIKIGSMKTYIQKSYNSMDVMFDATKMMKLMTTLGKVTNISTIQTLTNLLNSYDGLCVGFKMSK